MSRIYLVEDEENLQKLLVTYLQREGYVVSAFSDGLEAELKIDDKPDLWILDIMIPGMDGYSLIREIKARTPQVPVIFMSARNAELDRVVGLEMGSDDYLPKPFLPRELVLRVNRLLQSRKATVQENKAIKVGSYTLKTDERVVITEDGEVTLTLKEYELLDFLAKHVNLALSRAQMIDAVWGINYFGSERVVDDTLRRLRKKFPELDLEAIYGYGYRLKME